MDFKIKIGDYDNVKCEALALWFFKGQQPFSNISLIDKNIGGLISHVMKLGDFKGEIFEMCVLYTGKETPAKRIILIGLGDQKNFSVDKVRQITGEVGRRIQDLGIEIFTVPVFDLPELGFNMPLLVRQMVEGYTLGLYRFDHHLTKKKERKIHKISFLVNTHEQAEEIKVAIKRGLNVAEATSYARDLVNQPANIVTPLSIIDEAKKLEAHPNVSVQTWSGEEIDKLGFGGLSAVARGSALPPTFSVIDYNPKDQDIVGTFALVGKTITFDSGGLSLKKTEDMLTMKGDMGGGAAVLGIMWAVSRLKFPLRVIGFLPAAENMVSGTAYRLGDIIKSHSGQTIEITNTDAEGRLVLADALSYARSNYKFDAVIDIATLTGACTVALGRHAIGAMSNNRELIERVRKAGDLCHEKIVELPLWDEYEEMLSSPVADMKNLGGREAGAITAGAFLHKFIRDLPWVHLDIAGVAFIDKSFGYRPAGATGAGVRLLLKFLRDYIDDKKGPGAEKMSYAAPLEYEIGIEDYYQKQT